jgi:hypothetical protein
MSTRSLQRPQPVGVPAARPFKSRLRAPPEYSGPIGRRRSAVATHDFQPREWREWLGNRWISRPTNQRGRVVFCFRTDQLVPEHAVGVADVRHQQRHDLRAGGAKWERAKWE